MLLGLVMLALVWPLRHRFQRPLTLLWTVVGIYGVGRFAMFFYRADSEPLALGLDEAQWTSLALLAVAVGGWLVARARTRRTERDDRLGDWREGTRSPSGATVK